MAEQQFENVAGREYWPLESVHVGAFYPEANGKGTPEYVVMVSKVEGTDALVAAGERPAPLFVLRLKSAKACDKLIAGLTTARQEVFGDYAIDGETPANQ